uniref:DUF4587 domain-containing protein n=1 Tax=Athene cunicularia TaxID=194338 RepID=A0A663MA72_ATHCN
MPWPLVVCLSDVAVLGVSAAVRLRPAAASQGLIPFIPKHNNTVCLPVTRFSLRTYLILQEQHLLEELSQPCAPAEGQCHNHRAGLPHVYQIPFPAPRAEPPRIIQQMMPPQSATIIQQLPQPPPLITQIPPAQPFAAPYSGSIKEDMVEMMLMQNAQMHQIIMQNMMLKALPPMAFAQPAGAEHSLPLYHYEFSVALKIIWPFVQLNHKQTMHGRPLQGASAAAGPLAANSRAIFVLQIL